MAVVDADFEAAGVSDGGRADGVVDCAVFAGGGVAELERESELCVGVGRLSDREMTYASRGNCLATASRWVISCRKM